MVDHVIVTVKSQNEMFNVDMELPSKIRLGDLAPQLLENLKAISPHQFIGKTEIKLKCRNKTLSPNETLETEYVYDGAIIEVM